MYIKEQSQKIKFDIKSLIFFFFFKKAKTVFNLKIVIKNLGVFLQFMLLNKLTNKFCNLKIYIYIYIYI